jgi:hypothetical protein
MKKNLLFLTSHRQVEELYLYGEFLKKTQEVKNFDIVIHINNLELNFERVTQFFKNIPNKNKQLVLTGKNCGYNMGPHEAVSDNFPLFKNYDNVIHTHPDVYIVDEKKFLRVLNSNEDKALLVNYSVPTTTQWMSTDLFIFRPKLLEENIFSSYGDNLDIGCESFLYKTVTERNISHQYIQRFIDKNWEPRRPCQWGAYHEHDINKIKYLYAIYGK